MPKNVLGTTLSTTYHGSSAHKIFGTAGQLYQMVETVTVSTAGALSSTSIEPYGITVFDSSGIVPTSTVPVAYLKAPMPGVKKTLILNSTAAAWLLDVCLSTGSSDARGGGLLGTTDESSTGVRYIVFSSLGTGTQAITLVGLSTSMWAVESVLSSALWGAAGGIRATTVARTS